MNRAHNGYVYLIGAGPGDPGLITVKGRDCIAKSQVILYDYLANERLLEHAPPGAELIYAGKVGGLHNREQQQINDLLVEKAKEGRVVARLKGGDPFIFGRGGEECEALVAAGIPFEVVPGVSAAVGAAAYAGIPLTHRGLATSVTLITGHESADKTASQVDWEALGAGSGTLVFYMGVKNLASIAATLIAHGRSPATPVALIRWGTRAEQEVLSGSLADIAERARASSFRAPAITVIGDVVQLREQLRWFDNRPLSGRRIIVTRAADQAGEFSQALTSRGAQVVELPTISIAPAEDYSALDSAIAVLADFAWIIFSSVNAVTFFFDRLSAAGLDTRAIGRCRVCAVGPKTAAAAIRYGLRPDLVPADYRAEGVVASFQPLLVRDARILYPKADRARDVIPEGLTRLGATVISPTAYRNVLPERLDPTALAALEEGHVDCITFTSSSTVSNLADLLGENRFLRLIAPLAVASIGPVTSRTCRDLGLEVTIEPHQSTLAALTDAVVHYFDKP